MSDRPEGPTEASGDDAVPPPPPPPPGVVPTLAIGSESTVRRGAIGGRIVAGVVGALLLVGGVGFAAAQMGGSDRTPEQAVEELFEAIADEDVLGVLATLDPGERDTLTSRVEDFFADLERLQVLDESFELSGISGIDLEFSDLTFRTEEVRGDLVRVYLTGGTASYDLNTDELPVGDFLADTFERFGVDYRGHRDSDSDTMTPDEADDTFLVVRDGSDGWRISLGYTAAEAARVQSGGPVPSPGSGLTPIGADSPQAAVDGLLRAAADLDVAGVVARLSPEELGALQDYWHVLVDPGDLAAVEELDVDIELTDLELRAEEDGDRAQVFVDTFGVDVTADGVTGGGTVADGCITLRGEAQVALEELGVDDPTAPLCQDDLEELVAEAMEESGGLGMGVFDPSALSTEMAGETPAIGITTVRVDGEWFVAPIGTFADAGLAVLDVLDREDLDAAVDAIESFFGGFFGGGMLGSGFGPESLDAEGLVEEFEDIGAPLELGEIGAVPDGSGSTGPLAPDEDALLRELIGYVGGGDPAVAACAIEELYATATTAQLQELVDAFAQDFEPSAPTQDVFFTALQTCGW